MTRLRAPRRPGFALIIGLGALAAVGLNLRLALAAVSPLIPAIQSDYELTAPAAGLATTVAVLMFGVLAPVTPRLIVRFGADQLVISGLAFIILGALVRSVPGASALYAGMAMLGAGIGMMNVVLPVIVKRDFSGRVSLATGVYTASLNIGSAAAAAGAVPLALLWAGWRPALLVVIIPAVIAAAIWWLWAPRTPVARTERVKFRVLIRDRVAQQVTAYMLLQSLLYYVLLAWLPTIYADNGLTAVNAGFLLAVAQIAQLAACLLVPLITRGGGDQRMAAAGFAAITTIAFLGLALAPLAAPVFWAVLLGLGQGGALTIALMLIVVRSPNAATAAGLSGLSQGIGYSVAAFGPLAVGAMHDWFGGWSYALLIMAVLCVVEIWVGALAGRSRLVGAAHTPSEMKAEEMR